MRALPTDLHLRRTGFRQGTAADLAAMHSVESEVDCERRPGWQPQPVDSYIAFARNLPSQFDDHTWLIEDGDGAAVASAACWSNAAGDARLMESDVCVRAPFRHLGLGSALLHTISEVTLDEGRSLLAWSTFTAVPAGDAFSRHVGATVARVNRASEARLADVDWDMVDRWVRDGAGRANGYTIELIVGAYPPDRHEDAVVFHHVMQTAPMDDFDVEPVLLRIDDIAEHEDALVSAGRDRSTIFVRDPSGTCVGGTEVTFEPWQPTMAFQQNTGIDPSHRGLGLAKWAKAAMLEHIRATRPQIERVHTGNAFSNGPMLAINDALGFRVTQTRTEWQADPAVVRRVIQAD